ncbi:MAG: spermidine synthase [Parcubacteria group bacterium Greene0714_21]|nr:MAG: spermidine synthase [Parcubacteria group bacterium Greene0416_39]TSC97826.1 MAG: spermidine synthase [Parcubacteria group bacterium Greene1014_47]TSD04580.1 MAG: spermidine synthase [Parcubacteria group bacterium Greene0714_21]
MKESRIPQFIGVHVVADFWSPKDIENVQQLKRLLLRAAKEANSIPLEISLHAFSPCGLTGVVLVAESHIAIHTWPEIGYMAVDIFTCGKNVKPKKALEFLQKELKPKKVFIQTLKRGMLPDGIS